MNGVIILVIFGLYFAILYTVSYFTSRNDSGNDAFFRANRKSPWYIVAIGMIGTSISGVTFVSVPGMVGKFDMTYMQMVLGFFIGYLIVAHVLLPIYYKLNLTSIYTYLEQRFGFWSYKTGASFFILSRITGSAAKLYLIALILQFLVFDQWGVPLYVTVTGIVTLIWLYTRKSGIKTIVWTDTLQTLCFVAAAALILWQISSMLDFDFKQLTHSIYRNEHSRIFVFDDWKGSQNFWKQFFSGIFIVIVMTGLDQDVMQKNLTCKNLKDAQKNMLTYGGLFIPINLLFLCLGVLLIIFANEKGITLPAVADDILPYLVNDHLGITCIVFFIIGLVGASFANADSALTSLTTSFCIDILNIDENNSKKANKTRKLIHIAMSITLIIVILIIDYMGQESILNTIFKIASYTYGPLLGMFAVGLFTKIEIRDSFSPFICIASPLICYGIEYLLLSQFNYRVGYEILILNGIITAIGLLLISRKRQIPI